MGGGLTHHMLVSVGSCLFMIVSAYGFSTVIGPGVILDPSRVAAQVVSGTASSAPARSCCAATWFAD